MRIYLTKQDAIYGLHKNGYIHDFEIAGNDLLLIQEKIFVRAWEFVINECHQFTNRLQKGNGIFVFGISAPYHNMKGILLRHYTANGIKLPPVLLKKLNDMMASSATKRFEKIIQPIK